jgi:hypothetical protein
MITIEFISVIFSLTGLYYANLDKFKSGLTFNIANVLMLFVALYKGMVPLTIQMAFFYASSGLLLYKFGENKYKKFIIFQSIIVILLFIFFSLKTTWETGTITGLEVLLATAAIIGSFLLSFNNFKKLPFIIFAIVDTFYIYIAFNHGLFWFMLQNIIAVFIVIKGLKKSF